MTHAATKPPPKGTRSSRTKDDPGTGRSGRYVFNNLNGNYVAITADHGFLFTETAPGDPEKSRLDDKPANTVIAKKRYLLGYDLPPNEAGLAGRYGRDRGGSGRDAILGSQGQ